MDENNIVRYLKHTSTKGSQRRSKVKHGRRNWSRCKQHFHHFTSLNIARCSNKPVCIYSCIILLPCPPVNDSEVNHLWTHIIWLKVLLFRFCWGCFRQNTGSAHFACAAPDNCVNARGVWETFYPPWYLNSIIRLLFHAAIFLSPNKLWKHWQLWNLYPHPLLPSQGLGGLLKHPSSLQAKVREHPGQIILKLKKWSQSSSVDEWNELTGTKKLALNVFSD